MLLVLMLLAVLLLAVAEVTGDSKSAFILLQVLFRVFDSEEIL